MDCPPPGDALPGVQDDPTGEARAEAHDALLRALAALQRSQERWLDDVCATCQGEQAFTSAFRRWEEQLTLVKLQLHRVEARLIHFLLVPMPPRPFPDDPALPDGRDAHRRWRTLIAGWFAAVHLDGAYRRIDHVLDLDAEPVVSDIVTDLASLAEVVEATRPALEALAASRDLLGVDATAFHRVLAPWRRTGVAPLHDVLRWLSETLTEQDDW